MNSAQIARPSRKFGLFLSKNGVIFSFDVPTYKVTPPPAHRPIKKFVHPKPKLLKFAQMGGNSNLVALDSEDGKGEFFLEELTGYGKLFIKKIGGFNYH